MALHFPTPQAAALLLCAAFVFTTPLAADEATVITLTQTGCQFLEPEGKDHGYETQSADDCEKINNKNEEKRLKKSETITLKAGTYHFDVANKNVPYTLGFWLRGAGVQRAFLPSVSGGGIEEGETKRYTVTLKPGKYVYSCPLNPTPNYALVVE